MFLHITSIRQLLAYTVAALMMIAGSLIITGYVVPVFIQADRLQITFGVVLILFGIFRFVSAYYAEKRARWIEDDSWKSSSSTSSEDTSSLHH